MLELALSDMYLRNSVRVRVRSGLKQMSVIIVFRGRRVWGQMS